MSTEDTMKALVYFSRVQRLMLRLEQAERALGELLRTGDIYMPEYRYKAAEIEAAFEADRRNSD